MLTAYTNTDSHTSDTFPLFEAAVAHLPAETRSGAKPRLDTYANKGAEAGQRPGRDLSPATVDHNLKQDARYAALKFLWQISSLDRVRTCRRVSVRPGNTVDVRYDSDTHASGFAGLATCGSVWACPTCSARIQAERREELRKLMEWAKRNNFIVLFTTATLRHRKGQELNDLWDALSGCFKSVRTNGSVRKVRKEIGMDGYVRTVEVTVGGNGWHPHIHQLYILRVPEITDDEIDKLRDTEFAAWQKAAVKAGLGAPLKDHYRIEVINGGEVGDYLVKSGYEPREGEIARQRSAGSAAYELSGAATKEARRGSRTPFQVLQDFSETGNADDADLWLEYEQASKGRRALTWSNGLKDEAGINDRSDDDIASEEMGDSDDNIFGIEDWGRDVAPEPVLASQLKTAVTEGGKVGGRLGAMRLGMAFCRAHGIAIIGDPQDHRLRKDRQAMATGQSRRRRSPASLTP